MKRKLVTILMTAAIVSSAISGCGKQEEVASIAEVSTETSVAETPVESSTSEVTDLSDEEKAKQVADLIDSIYVQERTDQTDSLCEQARIAWDSLTDTQKEMVEGENADPDYFGRDTGDAIKDDPLNSDNIGENEILVVSFGTSFNDSRSEDIGGIETAIQEANSHWSVRRAFTAQIIINHVQARDGEKIDNVDQALERAVSNGVKNLVVQPTHLMHGAEYDELVDTLSKYEDSFDSVVVAEPLLGEVGSDATVINEDKKTVAEAVVDAAIKEAGYDRVQDADQDNTAIVLMGHGTSHNAKITYSQMQTQMNELDYSNIFIGTVEGEPEETSCENIINKVKDAGYKKVILRPLMVVAGDHANNDMAGDEEDSWKSMFTASGYFDSVDCQIEGMGRIKEVQDLYVKHTLNALSDNSVSETPKQVDTSTFNAVFKTDSSMFKVNETYEDLGTVYSRDGVKYIHISLTSQNIVNLFVGTADEAQKGENLLVPTKDTVKYKDGTEEVVNGFDIPVPVFGEEFDLAILGTKGKWYDHKVSVTEIE